MSIAAVAPALLARARAGDLGAIDAVLAAIQPGVFNLAMRMLGHREDARDATQEILLKVVTHLGGFRGDSAFGTWVWQVARRHLLDASTRAREWPQVSLESLAADLGAGLQLAGPAGEPALTPEDRAAARELAITCTQGMLMRLDRDHRIAWVLDATFGLSSQEAAAVLEIRPAAYRKRLSRARQALAAFADAHCGQASAGASCRCETQVRAISIVARAGRPLPPNPLALTPAEREAAGRALDAVGQLSGIAGVLRAHPDYQAPEALRGVIRAVLAGPTLDHLRGAPH